MRSGQTRSRVEREGTDPRAPTVHAERDPTVRSRERSLGTPNADRQREAGASERKPAAKTELALCSDRHTALHPATGYEHRTPRRRRAGSRLGRTAVVGPPAHRFSLAAAPLTERLLFAELGEVHDSEEPKALVRVRLRRYRFRGEQSRDESARRPSSHGATLSSAAHVIRIHLLDVQAVPRPSSGQEGPGGHLAELPAGGEDRRARPERLRQVDAAADHGRAGHRVPRRRPARARRDRRPAGAGAAARPGQGRARQRRGRGARAARHARPLQRARRQLLGRDRGRVLAAAGRDRRRRHLEPRHHARDRHGRAAAAAGRRGRRDAVGRRAPPRGALPAAPGARPTCCCSTSPRTTSTRSRWPGSRSTSRTTRARSWP